MSLNIYATPVKTKGGLKLESAKAKTKPAPTKAAEKKPAAPTDTFEAKPSVKSPRDASSGLATGRRQHKPLTLSME
ncbi:MAG: hypothetical protein JNM17_05345 [Archangium sp.]|nr:hypothetical protein [Archangium sp.]